MKCISTVTKKNNIKMLILADTMVCAGCCATLDHIVTYLFRQWTLKSRQNQPKVYNSLLCFYSSKYIIKII